MTERLVTFETYDMKEKTRLIAIEWYLGDDGIVQSHGASYYTMREHLKRCMIMGLDNPRARVVKRSNLEKYDRNS